MFCYNCNNDFFIRRGKRFYCVSCLRSNGGEIWKEKEKLSGRTKNSLIKYNISEEDFRFMMRTQLGLCSICGDELTVEKNKDKNKIACVDHDHKTGRVRGLLCNSCNWMIGHAKDNPEILIEAAAYLESKRTLY